MAKAKQRKLPWLIIVPTLLIVLFIVFNLFKNNSIQTQQSSASYTKYQDPQYRFSIEYPQNWEIKKDTQVFENGDAIAFRKRGPTQKERTELTDGVQVAVSKPFSINSSLSTWVKQYFSNQAEFSQMTIKDRVFEKVYNCSSLGCMRYFYTLVNGQVYGIAVFAEGPDKDKMVYENASLYMLKSLEFTDTGKSTPAVSREEAILKVKSLPEVIDYVKRVPNGLVLVNGEEDNTYMVQVYEIKDGHTATFNWYKVDKATGDVKKEF